jgi:hypothetical protein
MYQENHDPSTIDSSDAIEPNTEEFPKGVNGARVVNEEICLSRYELLIDMKRVLYVCQDRRFSAVKAWRKL